MKRFLVMIGFVLLVTSCGSKVKEVVTSTLNETGNETFIDEGALQGEIKECAKVINLHMKYQNEHNNAANDQIFTSVYIARHGQSQFTSTDFKHLTAKLRTISKNRDGSYTAFVTEKTDLPGTNGEEMDNMYVLKKENGKWLIDITD